MGQAKQRGTAKNVLKVQFKVRLMQPWQRLRPYLIDTIKTCRITLSQAENYFTGYVAAFDIKDGMELEGKESEWAYDGLPTPTALLKLVETELNEVIREDKEFLDPL